MTKEKYKSFMSCFRNRVRSSLNRIMYLGGKFIMSEVDMAEYRCHNAFVDRACKEFYGVSILTFEQRKRFREMFV